MDNSKNWFASWFDSPHYHILYKNRDYKEAEYFLKKLTDYLKPKNTDKILDLACGAGRHSIFLNKLGFNVTGVDLSPNSIETANESSNETLHFDVHDMREIYTENGFNYVFNMFTSFGYFESNEENIIMLQSVEKT
ncbi:MAG: class I SAM-dependent methyltransferase, partial [Flavobacteriales bacterium]